MYENDGEKFGSATTSQALKIVEKRVIEDDCVPDFQASLLVFMVYIWEEHNPQRCQWSEHNGDLIMQRGKLYEEFNKIGADIILLNSGYNRREMVLVVKLPADIDQRKLSSMKIGRSCWLCTACLHYNTSLDKPTCDQCTNHRKWQKWWCSACGILNPPSEVDCPSCSNQRPEWDSNSDPTQQSQILGETGFEERILNMRIQLFKYGMTLVQSNDLTPNIAIHLRYLKTVPKVSPTGTYDISLEAVSNKKEAELLRMLKLWNPVKVVRADSGERIVSFDHDANFTAAYNYLSQHFSASTKFCNLDVANFLPVYRNKLKRRWLMLLGRSDGWKTQVSCAFKVLDQILVAYDFDPGCMILKLNDVTQRHLNTDNEVVLPVILPPTGLSYLLREKKLWKNFVISPTPVKPGPSSNYKIADDKVDLAKHFHPRSIFNFYPVDLNKAEAFRTDAELLTFIDQVCGGQRVGGVVRFTYINTTKRTADKQSTNQMVRVWFERQVDADRLVSGMVVAATETRQQPKAQKVVFADILNSISTGFKSDHPEEKLVMCFKVKTSKRAERAMGQLHHMDVIRLLNKMGECWITDAERVGIGAESSYVWYLVRYVRVLHLYKTFELLLPNQQIKNLHLTAV